MISVQTVFDRMNAKLDAEGSERYLFDQDHKPAINDTIDWLVAVFDASFENNKLSGENLPDLIKAKIWTASNNSRIKFDPAAVGDELWGILRVSPKPEVIPAATTPPVQPNVYQSEFMPQVAFLKSDFSAHNLTLEKWNENRKNVFEDGNETLAGTDFETYAYLTQIDYSDDGTNYDEGPQIEIRPSVNGEFVGITYLKKPIEVAVIGDNIEFPSKLTTLFVEKALNFISTKQGDNTTLNSITEREVSRLIQIMT